MTREQAEIIKDALVFAEKTEHISMTSREFRELEVELDDVLSRAIPMNGEDGWDYVCPCCREYMDEPYDFCVNCGQAIDWGDKK